MLIEAEDSMNCQMKEGTKPLILSPLTKPLTVNKTAKNLRSLIASLISVGLSNAVDH